MNIRSSVRLNKSPAYKPGFAKRHVVCVLNINLMENAANWVRNKNNELANYKKKMENTHLTPSEISQLPYFQLIDFRDSKSDDDKKSTSNKLACIDNETILYIFCHGYIENTFDPETALQVNLKSSRKPEIEFSAKEIFKFLKNHKLDKNHKVLKLAACYSERFAQELSDVCKNYFNNMTVAGYYGELIVNQKDNHKYAGLVQESGHLIQEDERQYSIIDKSRIDPFNEMVQFYRAHNWRYVFKKGKLIEGPLKQGEADMNGFIPIPKPALASKKRKINGFFESKKPKKKNKKEINNPATIIATKTTKRKLLIFESKKTKEVVVSSEVSFKLTTESLEKKRRKL
jgi:hypothetical protein